MQLPTHVHRLSCDARGHLCDQHHNREDEFGTPLSVPREILCFFLLVLSAFLPPLSVFISLWAALSLTVLCTDWSFISWNLHRPPCPHAFTVHQYLRFTHVFARVSTSHFLWEVPHCMHTLQFLCPFTYWWTSGLFSVFDAIQIKAMVDVHTQVLVWTYDTLSSR